MTLNRLRRPRAGAKPAIDRSDMSGSLSDRALLSLREAVILSGGLLIGVTAGVLTYFAVHNLALSVLAGGPGCAGAVKFLNTVIG
jgi:hypothetical protein